MKKFESLLKYSKKLSVLYVEDHKELRESTLEVLRSFFLNVDTAEDGVDALSRYKHYFSQKKSYYDMVLTDIKMPNMNGVTLIENLYALNPKQKVIVISAHDESEYLLPLVNLGIQQFLQKPIEFEQLLEVLENISKDILSQDAMIRLNDFSYYNRKNKLLTIEEKGVYLTKYEIIFMDVLTQEQGKIYDNENIVAYYSALNEKMDAENIRKLVSKLRKKLPQNVIESVYGVGYRLV